MWTELFLRDWRSALPLMGTLGIMGGHDNHSQFTGDAALAASTIALDGRLLLDRQMVLEEWGPKGLEGIHLTWDYRHHEPDQLAEMMSVDAPLWSGLGRGARSQVESMFVPGQRRTVAVVCPGTSNDGFWRWLAALHEQSAGACQLHYMTPLGGDDMPYQYGRMFGGLFASASLRPTTDVICLPNGSRVRLEQAHDRPIAEWLGLVGFDLEQVTMAGPLGSQNRKALSIAAAFWASRNWNPETRHLIQPPQSDEWAQKVAKMGAAPELLVTVRPARLAIKRRGPSSPAPALGDMILCNACSLFDSCRLARTGSICTLPESDMGELAKLFNTRDSDQIIDALGGLLEKHAERVEKLMVEEEAVSASLPTGAVPALSEELTKMIHGLFDRGVKLAKLTNPALNSKGPQVSVNVGAGAGAQLVAGASPQALASSLVAELEQRGYSRDQITPELIARELGMGEPDPLTSGVLDVSGEEVHVSAPLR